MFKVKYNPDGSVAKFKIKLVVQKFSPVLNIDFVETFALTVKKKSLPIYLALCLMLNLFIYQVDIMKVYLESLLDDNKFPIFMQFSLSIQYLQQI